MMALTKFERTGDEMGAKKTLKNLRQDSGVPAETQTKS
jgi:hypothetical protein